MPKLHGKGTEFQIDNAAGQLTDISTYCDNVDFPAFNADMAEVSTFGATQKSYVNGLMDGTISISGPWDATLDAILAAIVGGAEKTYSYKPGGGSVTYSGECVCTSYQIQSPIGGAVTFSASFQLSGTVGRA
jgi:hypothetical protein